MQHKNIILGANGYIGKHLESNLKKLGQEVLCYDYSSTKTEKNSCQVFDITNKSSVEKIDWNVDYVYLLSGITGTLIGFDIPDKFFQINEIGLINVLSVIKNLKKKPKIIFPSTRLVYKGKDNPIVETDELDPKSLYALNKITCEKILHIYQKMFGINYSIFRIGIPYGSNFKQYSYGTLNFMIEQATKTGTITLYGDGMQKRTFTHIEDLCNQIVLVSQSENSKNEIFNIGGETLTIKEVATHISNLTNAKIIFKEWPLLDHKIETGSTYFDDSKINNIKQFKYKKISDWKFHK